MKDPQTRRQLMIMLTGDTVVDSAGLDCEIQNNSCYMNIFLEQSTRGHVENVTTHPLGVTINADLHGLGLSTREAISTPSPAESIRSTQSLSSAGIGQNESLLLKLTKRLLQTVVIDKKDNISSNYFYIKNTLLWLGPELVQEVNNFCDAVGIPTLTKSTETAETLRHIFAEHRHQDMEVAEFDCLKQGKLQEKFRMLIQLFREYLPDPNSFDQLRMYDVIWTYVYWIHCTKTMLDLKIRALSNIKEHSTTLDKDLFNSWQLQDLLTKDEMQCHLIITYVRRMQEILKAVRHEERSYFWAEKYKLKTCLNWS